MALTTITWSKGKVKLIDQTLLPERLVYLYLDNTEDLWEAIRNLRVRGAPALGIAAALGVVLGIRNSRADTFMGFYREFKKVKDYLSTSRPTAVNLFWALRRMEKVCLANREKSVSYIKKILFKEALNLIEEDRNICRAIGKNGARLIRNGDRILTHCNAGGLATADYGTALACMFAAKEQGKNIEVYADETRPLLQGARLTSWELKHAGIPVTLICDNMAGEVMREGRIDKVVVGADRIAANGDTANKIGTYSLSILAYTHRIPFYIAAPVSTIDFSISDGSKIPIEERKAEEVTSWYGKKIAPEGIKVYNPAFDVTPSKLITGIITELGIVSPPYRSNLKRLLKKNARAL